MTLDQLKVLEAIVETGSLRLAAEKLFRTQSTLSVAIKKLEEEFDLEIFSRAGYRNKLTPAGQALYQKAKSILKQSKEFEELGKQLSLGEEPEIRIALNANIPITPLLEILKPFEEEHPYTNIVLFTDYMFGSLERLRDGDVDFSILPWIDNIQGLESLHFMTIRRLVVASPDFPPCRDFEEIPQDVIKNYVQVIVKDSSATPDARTIGVLEGGRQWKVNDQYIKKEILLAGMGWGSLPEYFIREDLDARRLIPLNVAHFMNQKDVENRVARKLDHPVGPVAQRLWQKFL